MTALTGERLKSPGVGVDDHIDRKADELRLPYNKQGKYIKATNYQ